MVTITYLPKGSSRVESATFPTADEAAQYLTKHDVTLLGLHGAKNRP